MPLSDSYINSFMKLGLGSFSTLNSANQTSLLFCLSLLLRLKLMGTVYNLPVGQRLLSGVPD